MTALAPSHRAFLRKTLWALFWWSEVHSLKPRCEYDESVSKSTLLFGWSVIWLQVSTRRSGDWLSPLMNHRCVLCISRNRPISVSSLSPLRAKWAYKQVHCFLDDGDNLSQKWAFLYPGMCEVKTHQQIIYSSISHSTKLPEVMQVHQDIGTKPKEALWSQEMRKANVS